MGPRPTILDKIVAAKRREITAARIERPEMELRAALRDAPPVRCFQQPIAADGPIKLIAEIKKASPSKGVIREDFQPLEIARVYQQHGATCVSVLTDTPFFQGSLDILREVRQAIELPVLRKDFILEPYQVLQSRVAGADAVLLIAECLPGDQLRQLHDAVLELEMTALIELYDPAHLARVLDAGARLIGINNRDLHSFQVDLNHTLRLRREIPSDRFVVGESGIRGHQDVVRLEQAGVDAILVGEHLMASPHIGQAVDDLMGYH